MSKLNLVQKVPAEYSKATFTDIISAIVTNVNQLNGGSINVRFSSASVPVSVGAAVSDVVRDSNATVRGSVAPGLSASYVRLGWICTAGDATNPTWQEIRVLTGT